MSQWIGFQTKNGEWIVKDDEGNLYRNLSEEEMLALADKVLSKPINLRSQ